MKIGIIAYACGPKKGSEFRLGWNLPIHLTELGYDVTVFVGSSDGNMGEFNDILEVLAIIETEHSIKFVLVENDTFGKFLNFCNLKLGLKFLFYPSLNRWNFAALKASFDFDFDITHHLGPIGFRSPGVLWKRGIPHVWGPIGGAQRVPTELIKGRFSAYAIKARLKNVLNRCDLRRPVVSRAVKATSKFVFSTDSNREIFKVLYRVDGEVFSDQAMDSAEVSITSCRDIPFLFVGSIDNRKNIELLCEVFEQTGLNLVVCGGGPLLTYLISTYTCSNITFTGPLPRKEVFNLMRRSKFLAIPSLVEANTAVMYEALSMGCLPVANDRDGFKTELVYELLVDRVDNRTDMLLAWSKKVIELSEMSCNHHTNLHRQVSQGKSWEAMASFYDCIYKEFA